VAYLNTRSKKDPTGILMGFALPPALSRVPRAVVGLRRSANARSPRDQGQS